jgi:hypothetical protein
MCATRPTNLRPLKGTNSTRCWTRSAFEVRDPLGNGLRTIFKRNRAPWVIWTLLCQPSQAQLALSLYMRLQLFNLGLTKPLPQSKSQKLPCSVPMMSIIIRKLLLLAVLVTYIHGVRGKPDFSSITGMKFHRPTAEEMQRAHEAFSSQGLQNKTAMRYVKRSEAKTTPIKLRDVSTSQLQQAKALVAAAQASQAAYNKWNIENPHFNNYTHKKAREASLQRRENGMSPPNFSQEILDAIRLVGDVDAQDMHNNGTLPNYDGDAKMQTHTSNIDTNFYRNGTSKRAGSGSWMGQMQHVGTQPFGGDSTYEVSFTRDARCLHMLSLIGLAQCHGLRRRWGRRGRRHRRHQQGHL